MVVKFSESSHYYDCRGSKAEAAYDAGLREARKRNLYPSVTTLDKAIFPNEFLNKWKIEQLLLSAASTYKQPHESDDQYCQRIYEMSLDKPRDAADFGTRLHNAIEHYPDEPPADLLPWFNKYHEWHTANVDEVVASEKILFDHDIGVAGKCDRIVRLKTGRKAAIDYKTQGVKVDDKGRKAPAFYESWPRQLGFYAVCESKQDGTFPDIPDCISLVFDSTEPGSEKYQPDTPIFEKRWSSGEVLHAYRQFVAGAWLWFSGNAKRKAFWPAANGQFSLTPSIPMP